MGTMDDTRTLAELNEVFIEAFRRGSWDLLRPILSENFSYLDGTTGERWDHERYVEDLTRNPLPTLSIDQVTIHVVGNTAIVSARTSASAGRFSRYLDTYQRRSVGWRCVHACVWPCLPLMHELDRRIRRQFHA